MIPELQEIQDLVAKLTIQEGVRRVITQDVLKERCQHYMQVAKQELAKIGPEPDPDSSDFVAKATIFNAAGTEGTIPVGWAEGHKREMMYRLSQTCETLLAQAVITRNVATLANMQQVAKAMELNLPDPRDRYRYNYFEERMWKWITKNFGKPRLAALPPELRLDVILVAGMGPKLDDFGLTSQYRWESGKLVTEDLPSDGCEMQFTLIPRWWQ